MAINSNLNLLLVIMFTVVAFHRTVAKDHFVGGSLGWKVPNNEFFYDVWVINEGVIHINDVLVFNFANGVHNVAEVTLAAHDACDGSNPIQMYTGGPARVSMNTPGIHCFICTIDSHCKSGMKMIVRAETAPRNYSSANSLH